MVCDPIQSTFDQSAATSLFQAIRHQTQCKISGAVQQWLRQKSTCSIRGELKTEICLGQQALLLGSDPGLALKLHQILQPSKAMNRAVLKNNGELIAKADLSLEFSPDGAGTLLPKPLLHRTGDLALRLVTDRLEKRCRTGLIKGALNWVAHHQ